MLGYPGLMLSQDDTKRAIEFEVTRENNTPNYTDFYHVSVMFEMSPVDNKNFFWYLLVAEHPLWDHRTIQLRHGYDHLMIFSPEIQKLIFPEDSNVSSFQ